MRRSGLLLGGLLALAVPALAREWYEAYQEALRALARGQQATAALLLEEAIRQQPQPGVNLRTYGTNVERTYYPYLKLAEAHLALGNLDGARSALQRSEALSLEPADERTRLRARVEQQLEKQRPQPAPATTLPPATTPAPATPSAPPPTTAVAIPTQPSATPAAASPPPATMTPRRPSTATPPPPAAGAPASATLEILSVPPGALVYVDDEPLGPTNPTSGRLVKRDLAQGRHQVRIALEGYADLRHEVELAPGATTTLHAPLGRKDATDNRALLAAVAAAGVLAALALWAHGRRRRSASLFENTAARRAFLYGGAAAPAGPAPRTPRSEAATPTPADALPASFGEYQLLERIGRGGMASVFKAERRGELRALKRPRGSLSDDPQYLERFLREAEIGRALHHPNIIRIYERGEAQGLPYFTMELIDGETLAARLKREGALAPAETARVVLQIVEALDYAHSKGVIHRDLKPSNTMIARDGTVKVMDFGIARAQRFEGMTITGAFLGSPDYAAPETIEGRPVDARSDLYSVGVVLFELLTGRRPFEGDTPFTVLQKHTSEPPLAPSRLQPGIPAELEAITLRLLAKAPEGRYASAEELLLALRDFLDADR